MELFKLFGSILVDNDKANESISKTDKQAEGLGGKLTGMIGTAAKWGAALFAGASVAVGAVIGLTSKVGNMADRLLDLKAITGMSTDEIQRWERVTKVAGVGADSVTNASQKLTKQLDQLENGTGKASGAIEKLGITYDELNAMNQDERMDTLIKKLSEIEDPTERARIGTELFGGTWKEIAPIVDLGAEAMDKAKASADIFSEEDLIRANDFRISMDVMKDRVSFLAMEFAMNLIPVAQEFLDWIDTKMPHIEKIVDMAFTGIGTIVNVFINVLENYLFPALEFLWSWVEEYLPEIQEFFQEVFKVIQEVIETFVALTQKVWDKYGEDIKRITTVVFNLIKTIIETTLNVIRGIITTVTGIMSGDWSKAWEGIGQIFKAVWEGMKNLLPSLLEGLYFVMRGSFGIFKDIGRGMFDMVWEGMKGIWGGISSWVGDKVNWLTDKLTFWKKSESDIDKSMNKMSKTTGNAKSHFTGLDYVPYHNYPALLHKGERVLTAEENKAMSNSVGVGQTIENNFNIASLVVREEADIDKIAQKLYEKINRGRRIAGVTV